MHLHFLLAGALIFLIVAVVVGILVYKKIKRRKSTSNRVNNLVSVPQAATAAGGADSMFIMHGNELFAANQATALTQHFDLPEDESV